MTVMQDTNKFTEMPPFIPEFVVLDRKKMRRIEGGLAFYIQHQLASEPIHTYQDLYEQALEVE